MNIPFIVIIRDYVINTINQSTKETCERDFLDACVVNISNWDEYSQEDKDDCVENGNALFGNGSICLTWVDVTIPS